MLIPQVFAAFVHGFSTYTSLLSRVQVGALQKKGEMIMRSGNETVTAVRSGGKGMGGCARAALNHHTLLFMRTG